MTSDIHRSYAGLLSIDTFEGRVKYLMLMDRVSDETFAHRRHLNQSFYKSSTWRQLRHEIISRDMGLDLGFPGRVISGIILVHHIIPITPYDISRGTEILLDPSNLITISQSTHRLVHYGTTHSDVLFTKRSPGDTKLW